MNGQWWGPFQATNTSGQLLVDLDNYNGRLIGRAVLFPSAANLPMAYATLDIPDTSQRFRITTKTMPLHPQTLKPTSWEAVQGSYPGIIMSDKVEVTGEWTENLLRLRWSSDIGTGGTAELPRSAAGQPSDYSASPWTWKQFKEYVTSLEYRRFVFRGQAAPWRLRTTFHRSGRALMARFVAEDVHMLHRQLSGRMRHLPDLNDPLQTGSLLHLAQHHGYPTPLLDWSYSPFVAAFFAYRRRRPPTTHASAGNGKHVVRLFKFDHVAWHECLERIPDADTVKRNLTFLEFLAADNERMIPQQALSALTNVDDVEAYIRMQEARTGRTFLEIIDLPAEGRNDVMRELSMMGISAGALFPGLDGACEELAERQFPG